MKSAFQSVKNTFKGSKRGKMTKFVDEGENAKADRSVNFQGIIKVHLFSIHND